MKYKIIVDKQPRTNPTAEKREYEIDIEELRCKGSIADSLIITKDEDYVMRRLSLSEYQILSVLPEPVKEPLEEINIELFEGDNYIYLFEEMGNKFYAEYLVKNDFNDIYVTKSEMNSEITQTAREINIEVNKKVNDEDLTGANIVLRINNNASEVQINADKINMTGKIFDFTTDEMSIQSTNFKLDKDGKITATSGNIGGFILGQEKFSTTINGFYDYNIYDARTVTCIPLGYISQTPIISSIYDLDKNGEINVRDAQKIVQIVNGTLTNSKEISGTFQINSSDPKNFIVIKNQNTLAVSIGVGGVNTHLISAENIICGTQTDSDNFEGVAINGSVGTVNAKSFNNTSLATIKKNISKFGSALDILENSEIYEYNFKNEKDTDKKHIGFVIGEKYKTPDIVIAEGGSSVEGYSMKSINWRATQQLLEIVKKLDRRLTILEGK